MRTPLLMLATLCVFTACSPAPDSNTTSSVDVNSAIQATLEQQISDWNAGDVDSFMKSYWQDPAVRFASGGDVKRGWLPVLDQYKERYPDSSAMGELRTVDLEITPLADDAAMAFGRWIVSAGGDDYCGLFTLIFRNVKGSWVIVHDHTSSAGETMADGRTCSDLRKAAS